MVLVDKNINAPEAAAKRRRRQHQSEPTQPAAGVATQRPRGASPSTSDCLQRPLRDIVGARTPTANDRANPPCVGADTDNRRVGTPTRQVPSPFSTTSSVQLHRRSASTPLLSTAQNHRGLPRERILGPPHDPKRLTQASGIRRVSSCGSTRRVPNSRATSAAPQQQQQQNQQQKRAMSMGTFCRTDSLSSSFATATAPPTAAAMGCGGVRSPLWSCIESRPERVAARRPRLSTGGSALSRLRSATAPGGKQEETCIGGIAERMSHSPRAQSPQPPSSSPTSSPPSPTAAAPPSLYGNSSATPSSSAGALAVALQLLMLPLPFRRGYPMPLVRTMPLLGHRRASTGPTVVGADNTQRTEATGDGDDGEVMAASALPSSASDGSAPGAVDPPCAAVAGGHSAAVLADQPATASCRASATQLMSASQTGGVGTAAAPAAPDDAVVPTAAVLQTIVLEPLVASSNDCIAGNAVTQQQDDVCLDLPSSQISSLLPQHAPLDTNHRDATVTLSPCLRALLQRRGDARCRPSVLLSSMQGVSTPEMQEGCAAPSIGNPMQEHNRPRVCRSVEGVRQPPPQQAPQQGEPRRAVSTSPCIVPRRGPSSSALGPCHAPEQRQRQEPPSRYLSPPGPEFCVDALAAPLPRHCARWKADGAPTRPAASSCATNLCCSGRAGGCGRNSGAPDHAPPIRWCEKGTFASTNSDAGHPSSNGRGRAVDGGVLTESLLVRLLEKRREHLQCDPVSSVMRGHTAAHRAHSAPPSPLCFPYEGFDEVRPRAPPDCTAPLHRNATVADAAPWQQCNVSLSPPRHNGCPPPQPFPLASPATPPQSPQYSDVDCCVSPCSPCSDDARVVPSASQVGVSAACSAGHLRASQPHYTSAPVGVPSLDDSPPRIPALEPHHSSHSTGGTGSDGALRSGGGGNTPYVELLKKASRELHELRIQRDQLTSLVDRLTMAGGGGINTSTPSALLKQQQSKNVAKRLLM